MRLGRSIRERGALGWGGLAAVVVVGIHAGLWWLDRFPEPRRPWGDENMYLMLAERLLAGAPGWTPQPLWPAGYPQVVAGVLAVGGTVTAIVVFQGLLLAVGAVVTGALIERVSGSRRAGVVGALIAAAFPPFAVYCHWYRPEITHQLLVVSAMWLIAARAPRIGASVVAGVALGLAISLKSLMVGFVPVVIGVGYVRRGGRRAALGAAACMVACGAALVPELAVQARHNLRLGLASSAAFNVWVGLADTGREPFRVDLAAQMYGRWLESGATYDERQRAAWRAAADYVRRLGLARVFWGQLSTQPFRLLRSQSYLHEQLPGGAATRDGSGYVNPPPLLARAVGWGSHLAYAVLLIVAPFGWMRRPADRRLGLILWAFVAYHAVLFLFFHATPRYRFPLLPVLAWGFAVAATARRDGLDPLSRRAVFAAIAIAAMLLVVAFLP